MTKHSMRAAGIDTAKNKLDIGLSFHDACLQVSNDTVGYEGLCVFLRRHKIERIGIEASGGYERGVVEHLRREGFTVLVLQPLQVRAYAHFKLQRAKNDKIDARLIAECTAASSTVRSPGDARLTALSEHLRLIEQIEEDIARTKTRRENYRDQRILALLNDDIKRLRKHRKSEIAALLDELRKHVDLANKLDLLTSIPGLGERTAIALLIRMPELGSLSREEAASLAGLAPYDDDSAQRHGQRHIHGGRHRLRKSLYAASLAASFQWNPALKAFYQRLRAKGRSHKPALVACARKLLIYANTVLARGTPWTHDLVAKPA